VFISLALILVGIAVQGACKAAATYSASPSRKEPIRQVLKTGRQRQRAAALELALLQPGRPLFEVRASGFRQQRLLQ
jgi:hypothetical protein